MKFRLHEFLQRWDPDGSILTRAAGVTIGTFIAVGIVSSVRDLRTDLDVNNLHARIEQLPAAATADFEIIRVNYSKNHRGGVIGLQLLIREMTAQCARETLVVDLLTREAPDINRQIRRWYLTPEETKYHEYIAIPSEHLSEGEYALSVSPCGGGAPSKLAELHVSNGETPP